MNAVQDPSPTSPSRANSKLPSRRQSNRSWISMLASPNVGQHAPSLPPMPYMASPASSEKTITGKVSQVVLFTQDRAPQETRAIPADAAGSSEEGEAETKTVTGTNTEGEGLGGQLAAYAERSDRAAHHTAAHGRLSAQTRLIQDSNEALTLSLGTNLPARYASTRPDDLFTVRAEEDKQVLTSMEDYEGFHPSFTYPIYGEDEKLYGFQDLVIDLKFASGSLTTYLGVSYSAKLPTTAAETVDDVEGLLAKVIPPRSVLSYITSPSEFTAAVEADARTFRPFGEKISSYTRVLRDVNEKGKGKAQVEEQEVEFEVYHCTWQTPGFREYHRRMQLFIILYIEGGSYIKEEDEGWEFAVVYEKRKRQDGTETYHFVGYSSLFQFYHFPENIRMRLSQFVILGPYQGQRHGAALYDAIYAYICSRPDIVELTVEDPAEAFEDLRDRCDLTMLLNHETFMREAFGEEAEGHSVGRPNKGKEKAKEKRGKMGPPFDKAWLEKWRKELKIASRQFHRLAEMLQWRRLNKQDARQMKDFRLQVKERLYRFNFELLMQLEKPDRKIKLKETFLNVCKDYERIMAPLVL
ncbi:hypothetical protein NM688_g3931 [Phlebia brevispora]|uniref:Uncharacterized protein n=1 Tax=Phlebia brevispora TaxID=194682 RepID=A0ACC1T423_9APHY|nr:hypothetical protein NM688_g3931 [Phlebia brevispora]